MKKLFGFIFVLALAVVLFACGKEYKIEVSADQANVTVEKGESVTITPEFTEGETLVWVSSDEKVVKVEGGKLTAIEEGQATITITISGKEDKAKAEVKVTVKPISVKDITLTGKTACFIGEEFDLELTVTPDGAKDKTVTWASSDSKIATVNNGKVKALAAGEVTISATANDGSGKKAELKIAVAKINVNSVSISGLASMKLGETQTVAATIDPANATNAGIEFSSSDTSVVTVTAAGLVTAVGAGTAKIIATAKDDSTKKAELEITVTALVQEITIDGFDTMNVNETQKVDVSVDPEDAANKEYDLTSSNTEILTVDAEGNVKAVGAGTAKIIATAKDGSGVTGELEIVVTLVELISLDLQGKKDMVVNGEQTLKVSYNPEDASYKEVTFASSDPEVATVDAEGKVKALKVGKAVITATSAKDESKKATLSLEVFEATTALAVSGATSMFVGKEQNLVVTTTPAEALQSFDFASDNAEVLRVYGDGKVEALKSGTAKVTVTAKDGTEVKAEIEIAVAHEVVYVKLGATEDVTRGEETLKLNENLFATVDAALAAVGVGGKVVLYPGEYTEKVTIEKAVTLSSDLAEKNPVEDDTDFKDATKAAIFKAPVYVHANNITLEGLTFTGNSRVGRWVKGDKSNFTFQNNLVYDTYEATVAWKDARYSNGVETEEAFATIPGFLSLAGNYSWVNNTKILNNKFSNVSDTNVYIVCTHDITVKGNLFEQCDRDALRFDYNNNFGKFIFEDNVFDTIAYAAISVRSYGAALYAGPLDCEVTSNYFKNVGTSATAGTKGVAAFATAAYQETAGAKFVFKYNIFDGCIDNIFIRSNVTTVSSWLEKNLEYTMEVSYNAFVLADASAKINRSFCGSDSATSNYALGTFDNNFYGTDLLTKLEVTDANYENVVAKDATVYNSIYELEKRMPEAAHLPAYSATPALKTVAQAYELELNTPVALKGTVSYVYSGGFWLKDETGAIYVFGHADEVKLGDKVEVEGNLYNYKDTKRLNFAKTVKVTEAGSYTPEYAAKTEDEFKALTQAGLEITLSNVQVLRISNAYVYCKVGSTEFTINTNSNVDAAKFAAYISSEKKISINVLTYFKDGTKAMSVMARPDALTPEEGFEPLYYVVDANGVKKNNVVNKFSELTLADGMTIKVAAGTYDEELTIDKNNVTLEALEEGAILTAKVSIADGVEGLTVKGLEFIEKAAVIAAAPAEGTAAGVKNIKFDAITVVLANAGDDAWMHFYVPVENFTFVNSDCQFKTNRGIRFEVYTKDILIDNNKFVNTALHYDTIRAMNLADGNITISNNWFENTTQSFIMVRLIGKGNYNIVNNTFKNAACVSVDLRETKEQDLQGKAIINVLRNVFDGGENDWGTIRLRNSHATDIVANTSEALNDPTQVEVNINYNKFVNIEFDSDTTYYVDKPTKVCAAESWNIDNNYSDKGQPVLGADGWFCGMEKSAANWFESEADYEYAAFPPVYDFEAYFDNYAASWTTSYGEKVLTNADLGAKSKIELTFTLSNAAKQSSSITTMPTLAVKANKGADVSQYVTVTGEFGDLKYAKVTLAQWTTKTFKDIHLEYTLDGTTWTVCSASITTPGELASNIDLSGLKGLRIVYTINASGTSNVQLGLKKIEFAKEAPAVETPKANLTLDFMDGTVGSQYVNANWTQEKYTSAWETVTGQMNCREKDGVRVVNFTSGYGMTHRFTYSTGESLGLANKLTFKAGNYFDPKQPIPVKVILIDTKGNSHYLVGTADAFYEFPVTTGLVDQELTFDAIEVASIRIVAKYGGQASAYLYVGNMQLTFAE